MKLLQFILYCLFFAQMAFSAAAQSKDGWVLKSQRNAIKVFYRKTSDIHELKLTTSIKTPLSGIVHLLDDVDKYTVWGYKISEARLIKRISPTEIIYYSRIDFPWPMSDRDVVLRTTVEQDLQNNAVTSSSVAVAGWAPEVKDVIRLKRPIRAGRSSRAPMAGCMWNTTSIPTPVATCRIGLLTWPSMWGPAKRSSGCGKF
ncbi:MAG: hypothetical protein IPH12_10315 [Saprospirales bacterium]|nr:hypothetical protein [Saprospirales bacterium]